MCLFRRCRITQDSNPRYYNILSPSGSRTMPQTPRTHRYLYPPRTWLWATGVYLLLLLTAWVFAQPYSIIGLKRRALYSNATELALKSRNSVIALQIKIICYNIKDLRFWYKWMSTSISLLQGTCYLTWNFIKYDWDSALGYIWIRILALVLGQGILDLSRFIRHTIHSLLSSFPVTWSFAALEREFTRKLLNITVEGNVIACWSLTIARSNVISSGLKNMFRFTFVIIVITILTLFRRATDRRSRVFYRLFKQRIQFTAGFCTIVLVVIALLSLRWLSDTRFHWKDPIERLNKWLVHNAYEINVRWWGWLNQNRSK